MKYFVIALAAFFISSTAHAACTTFGTMTSCSDGNSYNKIGNTMYGSNSRTGSSWSQTTIGNSTYGTASDGTTRILSEQTAVAILGAALATSVIRLVFHQQSSYGQTGKVYFIVIGLLTS